MALVRNISVKIILNKFNYPENTKKPTWKDVGLFLSKFSMFCQALTLAVRFFLHQFQSMTHIRTHLNHLIWAYREQEVPKHKTKMISLSIRT
jgi:hypothetical protein